MVNLSDKYLLVTSNSLSRKMFGRKEDTVKLFLSLTYLTKWNDLEKLDFFCLCLCFIFTLILPKLIIGLSVKEIDNMWIVSYEISGNLNLSGCTDWNQVRYINFTVRLSSWILWRSQRWKRENVKTVVVSLKRYQRRRGSRLFLITIISYDHFDTSLSVK